MQAQNEINFKDFDLDSIDKDKAEFIYHEALEHHRGIIENNNRITDKALGILSFTMPIMTALAGYFAISWGNTSKPLFFAAICACIFLFIIMVFLLLIINPRGIFKGEGSPAAYFTGNYYKRDIREILIGNIANIHNCILHDRKIMNQRGFFLKLIVIFLVFFPVISFLVFLLCPRC